MIKCINKKCRMFDNKKTSNCYLTENIENCECNNNYPYSVRYLFTKLDYSHLLNYDFRLLPSDYTVRPVSISTIEIKIDKTKITPQDRVRLCSRIQKIKPAIYDVVIEYVEKKESKNDKYK